MLGEFKSFYIYAGIGVKHGVNLAALFDTTYIDLTHGSVTRLGTLYLCNKKPAHDDSDIISRMEKIEPVLRMWRNITIKGKIAVCIRLEISKIVYLELVTDVLSSIVNFTEQNTY